MQGYNKKSEYFVTQLPLADTVVDFWRLVKDYKCPVIMCVQTTGDQESMVQTSP